MIGDKIDTFLRNIDLYSQSEAKYGQMVIAVNIHPSDLINNDSI